MYEKRRLALAIVMICVLCGIPAAVTADENPIVTTYRYDDGPLLGDTSKFVLDGRSWLDPANLEYNSFLNFTPDMLQADVEVAIANAFALWSAACPNLVFSRIGDNLAPHDDPSATPPNAGDLRILFGDTNHGDVPFGAGVLAHAFFPPPNPEHCGRRHSF